MAKRKAFVGPDLLYYNGRVLDDFKLEGWTRNTGRLKRGMLVRHEEYDESCEVVTVRGGKAKINDREGNSTSIPADSAEHYYRWPDVTELREPYA